MSMGRNLFLCIVISCCYSIICCKDYPFSIELTLHFCWKSVVHTYVGLFLKYHRGEMPFLSYIRGWKVKVLAAQSCQTLCNPMDYRPARFLRPRASPSKNIGIGSCSLFQVIFWSRDRTWVSCIADRFFTIWATREASIVYIKPQLKMAPRSTSLHHHHWNPGLYPWKVGEMGPHFLGLKAWGQG